ncbi:LytR/AlgR family response regulator transcription factor [Pseudobacter ginsenosidimutans]|uniref:LytTR family two component transcriptional regulator n=1 Tax=Pseudobacter ginsenosidimutans TaxID=661488 RepID=A0A4Q7MUF4_9BACT|nr:LytTR family DNA-binding domain-containing protein [Pseudobacter ginsenosidimutans]QEC40751.1 response regulator transcription factor [Pseudobacter ginsenosidimutans]RZS72522.1 LytTR family two component transcriptional regulator [Pseudobacter ginsenosidimutans]
MIKCLICDDELIAHQILEAYILQTPGLVLVAKCRNALEAFAKLEQQSVDLIFLDIEMPLVNGINFLKTLSNPPKVIFTTAYAEHALESYELNAVDYLLKPFSPERFAKAVEKAKALIGAGGSSAEKPEEAGALVVKEKDGMIRVQYNQILYIEASKDYMKIVTNEKNYLVHITMKKLEESLPPEQFVRTHKSFMVALKAIRLLKPDELVLTNNAVVPVSINYRDMVTEKFKS